MVYTLGIQLFFKKRVISIWGTYLFSSSIPCWFVAVSVTSVPDASPAVSSMIGSKLIKDDAVEAVERLLGVL